MAILSIPTITGIRRSRFGRRVGGRAMTSPFTGYTQTTDAASGQWYATYTLPPMKRAKADIWRAWLLSLKGRTGRFYGYDPDATSPRGAVGTSTPLVKGGSQTGSSLLTDGWDAGVTGILKAGDYVAFDVDGGDRRLLRVVTADVNSDGSGNATLPLDFPIRTSPDDNEPLILTKASCVMMLDDEATTWDTDEAGVFTITFGGVEAYGA